MRRALAVAGSALLAGCSLLGLDSFAAPMCTRDADCDAINEATGIGALECMRYQCAEAIGSCTLRARDDDDDGHAGASCGGDDCDDADPLAYPGAPLELDTVIADVGPPAWLHWGVEADRTLAVSFDLGARRGAFGDLELGAADEVGYATDENLRDLRDAAIRAGCPVAQPIEIPPPTTAPVGIGPATCQTHAECDDGAFCNGYETCDPRSALADARGCRPADGSPCASGDTCDEATRRCLQIGALQCSIGELATGSAGEGEWIAIGINRSGCDAGQLRAGWLSSAPAELAAGEPGSSLLVRGDERRAPAFWGIDLVGSGADAACSGGGRASGDPRGVASPSLAVLAADPSAGRRRPQALAAWLAAPRCRGTGECAADSSVGIELLGLWYEEAPASGSARIAWVTASGSGVPSRLGTRTPDTGPVAIAATSTGYAIAYGAESGGLVVRLVSPMADPPGVGDAPPYATIVSDSEARTTPPLSIGDEQAFFDGAIDEVSLASGVQDGDRVPLAIAWSRDGGAWVAIGELAAGRFSFGEARRIADGGATAMARIDGGWSVAMRTSNGGAIARLTSDGAPDGAIAVLPGARWTRPSAEAGALRALFYDETGRRIARTHALCR